MHDQSSGDARDEVCLVGIGKGTAGAVSHGIPVTAVPAGDVCCCDISRLNEHAAYVDIRAVARDAPNCAPRCGIVGQVNSGAHRVPGGPVTSGDIVGILVSSHQKLAACEKIGSIVVQGEDAG